MQAGGPAVSPRPAPTAAGNPTATKLATHAILQHAVAWCVLDLARNDETCCLPHPPHSPKPATMLASWAWSRWCAKRRNKELPGSGGQREQRDGEDQD